MLGDVLFAVARLIFAVVSGIADWWNRRREGVAVRLRKSLEVKKELVDELPAVLKDTNGEVVIREVRRRDSYPDIDNSLRRISPWFKSELKGLYYGGLEVFLAVDQALIDEKDVARQVSIHELGSQKVFVVGRIPFWRIEAIDWDGDEFYGFTHIYCRFRRLSKGPYEDIVLYEKSESSSGSRYSRLEGVRWKPKRFGLFARWKSRRGLRKAEKDYDRQLQEEPVPDNPPEDVS